MRRALAIYAVFAFLAFGHACGNAAAGQAEAAQKSSAAVNISGVWEAQAMGSSMEAFVAQKGSLILALVYVTEPSGKISSYHMGGFLHNGVIHVTHRDGAVFDGSSLGPDEIHGILAINSYMPKIETTAARRTKGKLRDEEAESFFREALPLLPDPGK